MEGLLSSFLSMSAVDGEGIRCVAFMQGCPLRCVYCHNPEMRPYEGGDTITPSQLYNRLLKYRKYFGKHGGVTLSGGEPFLQSEFTAEFFALCKKNNINTAIETSGAVLDDFVKEALGFTDLCMLDIKMTREEDYKKYINGSLKTTLEFLKTLNNLNVRTWIRQVIIPGINDNPESVFALKEICKDYACVEKISLLPFKKICMDKYKTLGLDFPLAAMSEADENLISELEKMMKCSEK